MKAVISTKERTLMYGEDYSIEYDHRLGYYRAQLHTNDDSNEYFYQLGSMRKQTTYLLQIR